MNTGRLTRIESLLAQADLFGGLSAAHRKAASAVCRARTLRKRDTLFMEGARGEKVFVLVRGSIQLSKSTDDGRRVVIRTVKPGETFGEVILFEQNRYPVTATVLSESEVLEFLRPDVLRLVEDGSFRKDFIAMLMKKQRYLADRVRYLAAYDPEERLARFLREQYGERDTLHAGLSKKDIASAIGATPETLSRLIQSLRDERLVDWKGRRISISARFWARHPHQLL